MARRTVFLELEGKSIFPGSTHFLTKPESHHLVRVLRAQTGDGVLLLNGKGVRAQANLVGMEGNQARLEVESVECIPPARPGVVLCQGYPKGKVLESIIRVGVELGLTRLIPLLTRHVEGKPGSKVEKWQQVAREAAKQSGCAWLPEIAEPMKLEPALEDLSRQEDALFVVGSLEVGARNLFSVFEGLERRDYRTVVLFVGPEGDFAPAEYARIREAGAVPVSMGDQILRSETAAHVFTAMVAQWFRR